MKIIHDMESAVRPPEVQIGPTGRWMHYDITPVTVKRDGEDDYDAYQYDGYWFDLGEFEALEAGTLPDGAQWDDRLHAVYRRALHHVTDDLYMIANRMVRDTDSDDWRDYRRALDAWNESVSAMADGYSMNVPKLPEAP